MAEELDDLEREYQERRPHFDRLGQGIVASVEDLLGEAHISCLDIATRTKGWASVKEKLLRKHYSNPFTDMEDWCGVRIICYYPSDVEKILEIIRKEFEVISEENTAERLGPQEFGYRSVHLIVQLRPEWLHVPAHRGLKNVKAEIQVRTVLMHAWAEIQHKLAYKSQDQIPANFQRQFYRLSAKFEEADEQFDALRRDLQRYRRKINVESKTKAIAETPLNLETFIAFLERSFPDRTLNRTIAAEALGEIQAANLNFQDLQAAIDLQRASSRVLPRWSSIGAIRNALDLYSDKYLQLRQDNFAESGRYELLKSQRESVGKKMPF